MLILNPRILTGCKQDQETENASKAQQRDVELFLKTMIIINIIINNNNNSIYEEPESTADIQALETHE
jgi:hypothetical protein